MTTKLKVSAAIVTVLCAADGLSATRVLAEGQEERQACISDAFKFCVSAIPDRNNVFICLTEHSKLISAACQMAIAHHPSVDRSAKEDSNGQIYSNK